jgi:two-component system cell cycle response regulator CpdR
MRIVVVDDERLIAFTLSQILALHGYCVSWFQSPSLALEHIKMERPDLVISDVMMAEMDGSELAQQVSAHVPDCSLLLFSAVPEECQPSTGFIQRARIRILAKPLAVADLLGHIKELGAAGTRVLPEVHPSA